MEAIILKGKKSKVMRLSLVGGEGDLEEVITGWISRLVLEAKVWDNQLQGTQSVIICW